MPALIDLLTIIAATALLSLFVLVFLLIRSYRMGLKEQRDRFSAILKDIEEERAYETIQSQALLKTIGEGIVITSDEGVITYINPAFEKMLGFNKKELKGKIFAETLRAFDLNEKPLPIESLSSIAAITAKRRRTRILLEAKDGSKLAVVISAAPIYVDHKFRGIVRAVHDFTPDLELQRQKDEFFSIASHELRTPLTVISGNLDMFLRGYGKSKISSKDKQLLKDTEVATDRLTKMVSDFLSVSRLDQGRLEVNLKPLDGCRILAQMVKELASLAKEKKLELNYNCEPKKAPIMADEDLLKQVIINLVGNSIKFTEKGSVMVDQTIKNGMLLTTVTDTGIGIAKDRQKFLFRRFQQAMGRTLAREVGGTGLGLYISREFCRLMGGDLKLVKSEAGKGSVFAFTLPLVKKKAKKSKK